MAIKITVGGGQQVIPNAKEVLQKIKSAAPVLSVNGMTGAVTLSLRATSIYSVTASLSGLGNVRGVAFANGTYGSNLKNKILGLYTGADITVYCLLIPKTELPAWIIIKKTWQGVTLTDQQTGSAASANVDNFTFDYLGDI